MVWNYDIMSAISEFGPGHFDFTFMCGDRGINEIDLLLLKHLIHYKKVPSVN